MPWIIFVIITLVNTLVSKSFSNLIACFPLGWEVLYSGVLAAEWVDHLFPCKIFLPIECPVSFIYQYEYIIWYSMILFVRWMPQVLKKWKLRGHFSQDVIGCKTQVAFINSDCSALMPRMNKGNRWQQTLETVVKKNKYTVASSGHNTFSHFRFREQERKPKGWCQSEIQCSTITKPWSTIQGKDILKTLQFTSDCSSSCDKHEAL